MSSASPYASRRSTPRPERRPQVELGDLLAGAPVVGAAPAPGTVVSGITVDSRLVQPGDLYLAVPGSHAHGATFAADAVRDGAVAVLTDPAGRALMGEGVGAGAGAVGVPVVTVDQPRALLARLAVAVYGSPVSTMRMFGLTGTNGKTTTSYLLEAATRSAGLHTGVIGTIGFTLDGEPLPGIRTTVTTPEASELQALLAVMAERSADAVVMEVSSHALALGRADGIRFDVAGFTNLGRDHLDFHGDLESYFEAKARLFTAEHTRRAVINVDDPRGRVLLERARADGVETTTVALDDPTADWSTGAITHEADGSSVLGLRTPDGSRTVRLGLPGDYNVRNAITALAMAAAVGVDLDRAAEGIADARVPGRMQRVPLGPDAPTVVVDFAHTPQAVTAALQALTGRRRIVVLGCGGDRDRAKRGPMGAAATAAELVVVTDDNPRSEDPATIRTAVLAGAREAAGPRTEVIDGGERRAAIRLALASAAPDDVVAVLGKGHETGQEISGRLHPFDDVVVVAEEWAALGRQQVRR